MMKVRDRDRGEESIEALRHGQALTSKQIRRPVQIQDLHRVRDSGWHDSENDL